MINTAVRVSTEIVFYTSERNFQWNAKGICCDTISFIIVTELFTSLLYKLDEFSLFTEIINMTFCVSDSSHLNVRVCVCACTRMCVCEREIWACLRIWQKWLIFFPEKKNLHIPLPLQNLHTIWRYSVTHLKYMWGKENKTSYRATI